MTQPPLAGIRVIELATVFAGPGVGLHLADQGAEVIKVEPIDGDPIRGYPPSGPTAPGFLAMNRNKRGIAVNLRTDEGRAIVARLIESADIVIENFRPGILARMNFDYETHSERNPGLIWLSVTGYGSDGPLRERRGYDLLAQALSGSLTYRRWPDGTPMISGVLVGDIGTSIGALFGVTLALLKRAETGRGQRVSSTLLNSAAAVQGPRFIRFEDSAPTPPYRESARPWQSPYRCADGSYLMIALLVEKEWADLLGALDLEHILHDPRHAFPPEQTAEELAQVIAGVFETRTRAEWLEILLAADVTAAAINTVDDALFDPEVRGSGAAILIDDPIRGRYWAAGTLVQLADNPPRDAMSPPPAIGQHTDEVLAELGFSPSEIGHLRSHHIVA